MLLGRSLAMVGGLSSELGERELPAAVVLLTHAQIEPVDAMPRLPDLRALFVHRDRLRRPPRLSAHCARAETLSVGRASELGARLVSLLA